MQLVNSYKLNRDQGTLHEMALMIQDVGRELGWSERSVFQVTLTLDEIITNTLNYGYQQPDTYDIEITVRAREQLVQLEIRDNAMPFNPVENVPMPELHKAPLERKRMVGGMGVHIVRMLMDSIEYRYEDGRNVLTMVKDLAKTTC